MSDNESKCEMTHQEPFDFAQCHTHDTTFPLGGRCKFDGREPWEVFAQEADEQRQLKVRAEIELDRTRAELAAANAIIELAREFRADWGQDLMDSCCRTVVQRRFEALGRILGGVS